MLKRILKRLFKWAAWSTLTILIALVALIEHPSLILRPKWVLHFSEKAGVHWKGLRISSKSVGFLKPELSLRWDGVRVRTDSVIADAGPGRLDLGANFLHFPPRLSEVGPVQIHVSELEALPSPPKKGPPSSSSASSGIPSWARSVQLGAISLQVDRWKASGDSGSVVFKHEAGSDRWKLEAREAKNRASVLLDGRNKGGSLEGPWDTEINAEVHGVPSSLRVLRLERCRIDFDRRSLEMNCPLVASASLPHIRGAEGIRFAERFPFLVTAKVQSGDLYDLHSRIHGDVSVRLLSMNPLPEYRNLVQAWGEVRLALSGVASEPAASWQVESTLDLQAEIAHFQRLVRILDPTLYAVPAPLHALRGTIRLSVQGKGDPRRGANAPIRLVTRLSSPNQDLDLDITAKMTVNQFKPILRASADGEAILTNVRIPLPRIDFDKFPQVVPDARFSSVAPKQRAGTVPASELSYDFKIKTNQEPVRVLTNLAKSPVPVRTDLELKSGQPIRGKIHIDSFPLDLFRRNAKVDHLDLELTGKEKRISGLVNVEYTDYLVHIYLAGTVDQPEVSFTSEPDLSQQDIISVLLFGRTSEDLDSGQTQSVGNVSAAATARGLDLASLYFLASTPVESVGYDPQSGTFSAEFKVAEGTSLSVAEAQEQLASIGLRKRIGSHWAITTQYGNPADPTDKSISTLLEWSHRY